MAPINNWILEKPSTSSMQNRREDICQFGKLTSKISEKFNDTMNLNIDKSLKSAEFR